MSGPTAAPLVERFIRHVNKAGPVPAHRPELGPCWAWTASTDKRGGYGRFGMGSILTGDRRIEKAHRVAFYLEHGRWPDPCALHHCDNPGCVRPSHLFEGTREDNNADRDRKGRCHRLQTARLTDEDVRAIRTAPATATHAELAEVFGISEGYVYQIRSGRARAA